MALREIPAGHGFRERFDHSEADRPGNATNLVEDFVRPLSSRLRGGSNNSDVFRRDTELAIQQDTVQLKDAVSRQKVARVSASSNGKIAVSSFTKERSAEVGCLHPSPTERRLGYVFAMMLPRIRPG